MAIPPSSRGAKFLPISNPPWLCRSSAPVSYPPSSRCTRAMPIASVRAISPSCARCFTLCRPSWPTPNRETLPSLRLEGLWPDRTRPRILLLRAEPIDNLAFALSIGGAVRAEIERRKLHMRLQPFRVALHESFQVGDGGVELARRALP